jgi:hypothetical protein
MKEFGLPAIAWMTNLQDVFGRGNPWQALRCIIAYRNHPLWRQQAHKFCQEFFAGSTFLRVMRSIGKRIARLVGMKRKDIPKEDRNADLLEDAPDDGRCSFGNWSALGWPIELNTPTGCMTRKVDIIRQIIFGARL